MKYAFVFALFVVAVSAGAPVLVAHPPVVAHAPVIAHAPVVRVPVAHVPIAPIPLAHGPIPLAHGRYARGAPAVITPVAVPVTVVRNVPVAHPAVVTGHAIVPNLGLGHVAHG